MVEFYEPEVRFEDFGRLDPQFVREVLWQDISKQHRMPEEYRVGLRTWAAAISHAPLAVANHLTYHAPDQIRTRLASIVVYQKPSVEEAEVAHRLLTLLYGPDLKNHRGPATTAAPETVDTEPPSELGRFVPLRGRTLLDTRGTKAALAFVCETETVYGLERDAKALGSVYRLTMARDDDVLRIALGTPMQVGLPTGRVHVVRARPTELSDRRTGRDAILELIRVLSSDGILAAEGEAEEIARLVQVEPAFERLGNRVAIKKAL